ncbi:MULTISPECIES: GNAT family N-acetyltransferase [Metabacillus]|jgi:Acetyltransferase (GNAT) domain|uniref:GNAT family N-acetyltransferase n=1 Tax=Metabacillus hrfriensis TaxID=3048891 RepID=A0ACD4RER7_9BACI|nr:MULTISPECIES: GNAT family N-acetyltransferase [Metabacillus]UAL53326.1 GNAT family N-acetyltransferase [Metabacillus dongyingensis]UOK58841.1 GNAT family N-acetyltransferase [Bacillus sp. OVS6]USK29647.1 GNAT family N-acetyltransferase [Bacillus sp. CMF21]WHZ58891.1 GNAT family N-acetyltransferase [Metabacillus sp. CT-WN-B3]
MNWYEKLNQYFPIEEMKSKEHIETLLKERGDIYHKDEGEYHVLMYAELEDFIFIDYLFVSKKARGQGLGHKLISNLKELGKPIILEVEPVDEDILDTGKRLKFYQREGFQHAKSIGYRRKSLATNEVNAMEILYWSPEDSSEELIYEAMKKTYLMIHTYKDKEFYGKEYQDVQEVLSMQEQDNQKDIFDGLD